jgi:ribulose-5-phosphate 4-epimerase/fuculose-1-phosphate aldolase
MALVDYELQREESLRGTVSDAEWEARVELAAAFRISVARGWNNSTANHMTARVPDQPDYFLMNAGDFGWGEITASNLLKLDMDGNVVSDTDRKPRPAGLNFHSALQRERRHLGCTIHIHALAGVVVSAWEEGLQFFDQGSCGVYGQVAYHDFEGIAEEADEAPRILSDLGDKYTLIMRNHGLLSVGRTVPEAMEYMDRLVAACETQERILSTSHATPRPLSKQTCETTAAQFAKRAGNKPIGGTAFAAAYRQQLRDDPSFAT